MKVFLISSVPNDRKFFDSVSKFAGYELMADMSSEQVCEEIQKDPTGVIIVDASTPELYQKFETVIADKIGLYSPVLNTNHIFFLGDGMFHEMAYITESQLMGTFIHRSFKDDNVGQVAKLLMQSNAEKAFGLENFFSTPVRTQSIQVTKSLQKKVIVESLKNHLLKIGFKSRMAAVICTATDELVMNAIFDAPVDELGKHLYSQTPRNAALELTGKNIVEMKVAFDGKILGISVTDNHGSLNKKKLLSQHLGKSYESKQYEAKASSAGAGLGLSHVYRNCGGIVFICDASDKTEVVLFYKKTDSFVEFKDQFRFLSTMMYFA